MQRTPLLRAFEKLAEEHHAAERLGIAPAELRERRAEAAFTRRDFLQRAGAAGAAVAVAGPAALARPSRASAAGAPRIAIVGGGIAGLTAALTLQDNGVAATVYEASKRIGGRMHSDRSGYWDNAQVSESCGELIDSGHQTILDLASRFSLPVDDLLAAEPAKSDDTYFFLGSYYPVSQADADFRPVRRTLNQQVNAAGYPTLYNSSTAAGRFFDHMSVYDWIERYVPGGHASRFGSLLDVAYNEEYGAETTVQSALDIIYLLGFQPTPRTFAIFGASDEQYHIRGGNEQLPQAIAATLADVRTSWRLTSIRQRRGIVTMQFDTPEGEQTIVADHVVVCMSFSVLRTLDYEGSGLDTDARKNTAIQQLGSGRNAKLQLQFESRYWNTRGPWGLSTGNTYSDLGFQNAWDVTRAQPGATGILNNYMGGDVAGALEPSTPYSNAARNPQVTAYAKAFLRKLEVVFPGIRGQWNGKATLSAPFLDPNLLLSYSYWKVGQYTSFSGYEKQAIGAIHFAGEHCSQDFQGFMEGAASEGVRAGNEVLAALGISPARIRSSRSSRALFAP